MESNYDAEELIQQYSLDKKHFIIKFFYMF
jgi:hypothetical protein